LTDKAFRVCAAFDTSIGTNKRTPEGKFEQLLSTIELAQTHGG
jgi:hypothetical protein